MTCQVMTPICLVRPQQHQLGLLMLLRTDKRKGRGQDPG
jgi:hypothetical protein